MRMSCNGCRVLRKGCSDNCSIRPCLQWIKNPESQANATVFLAKFYGRAGLMNLINAGPDHLRPGKIPCPMSPACRRCFPLLALVCFRLFPGNPREISFFHLRNAETLLYLKRHLLSRFCFSLSVFRLYHRYYRPPAGRIVNPIYGSVGLLWSGSWPLCQAAVEAVLKGAPITQIPTEAAANSPTPPLKAYDIRHVSKHGETQQHCDAGSGGGMHKLNKSGRTRFKRPAGSSAVGTEDSSHNDGGRKSTSPDSSDRARMSAGLQLGGPQQLDLVEEHAGSVADAGGFLQDSCDEFHDDDRDFHELRLMDDTAAAAATTLHRMGGDSGSASANHHDSPDASMVTSHNHGGATSEEDEDHDREQRHEGAVEDEIHVELTLTLGAPKRRRC